MSKSRLILPVICLAAILTAVGWYFINQTTASSQGPLPGTGPIKDEAGAIAVARTVALSELASEVTDAKVLPLSVKKLSEAEYAQELAANGESTDITNILGKEPNQEVWSVTFSGAFSPKRVPPGTKAPVFSKMTIYLKSGNGFVIGVHEFEEVPAE